LAERLVDFTKLKFGSFQRIMLSIFSPTRIQIGGKTLRPIRKIVEGKYEEVIELFRGKYGRSQIDYWYGGSSVERKVVEIHIQGN